MESEHATENINLGTKQVKFNCSDKNIFEYKIDNIIN